MVSRPPIKIEIDPSVTEEQRCDPRFQKLLKDAEEFFNSPKSRNYKLMLGLHEGGHAYFARRAGAINVRFYRPKMCWDSRPHHGYNCPAISRSSCGWTATGGSVVANVKASLGGYICRRELSNSPNDHIAIESDLDGAREWFDRHVGTGEETFKKTLEEAEREILEDLKSQFVVYEIWAEAKRFVEEVFQTPKPMPKTPKPIRIKVGRNDPCPCGSGRKFKKCHLSQPLPEPLVA